MVDTRKIKRYSDSLIIVANQISYDVRLLSNNLSLFNNYIKNIRDLRYLIMSKRINLSSKLDALKNIFSKSFNDIELEFICLLVSNGDISLLGKISQKLNFTIESTSNIKKILITLSQEVSSEEKNDISNLIKQQFELDDSSESIFNVDANIIGGIKIRIGNKIIDGSVSTKLQKIKQSLLSV